MRDEFWTTYIRLSRELLKYACHNGSDRNIVLSPFSILTLLVLMEASTAGETQKEISSAVSSKLSAAEQQTAVAELIRKLDTENALRAANAIFASSNYQESIKPDCLKKRQDLFETRFFSGDNIAPLVNNWVDQQTAGMIPELLDERSSDLVIGLANALSFSSSWETPYYYTDLHKGIFHNSDRSSTGVTFMDSNESAYIEDGFFTGFIRRYEDRFDFMALLPKKTGKYFLKGILDEINLGEMYRGAIYGRVEASIPEFQYNFSDELTDFCRSLGINKAYSTDADFSPMTDKPAWINTIIHKARIEVNRHGTKAAAASFGGMAGSAPPFDLTVHEVKLNRPFLFAVVHRDTGVPIFVGLVNSLR